MSVADSMRRDWDERARKDAFRYIASWRERWDAESFFQSGEEDYRRCVAPVLSRLSFEPRGKVMLELGCGAGRMTRGLARRFDCVYAFDVSAEMLKRAQTLLADAKNIAWVQGNGLDLSGVGSDSVDFVFSYLVLQHLPGESLALDYTREMLRVLKEDGVFLFQFNSLRKVTMNWKGRLIWGVVDSLWALGLSRASWATAALFSLDPNIAGKSWRGAAVDVRKVMDTVSDAGGSVRGLSGEGTAMTWSWGVKSARKN